jgi:type IV pilus assembly protein PilP
MIYWIPLALFGILFITGCASDHLADLEAYVVEIKARDPGPIKPLPDIKPVETFTYQDDHRRDPFQRDEAETEGMVSESTSLVKPDPLRRREELEQYSLDSLRMVGTLSQDAAMWALVLAKGGTLFRVRAGNYMGRNHGQIVRITEDRIELTEIVSDGLDGWQERPAAIALSE